MARRPNSGPARRRTAPRGPTEPRWRRGSKPIASRPVAWRLIGRLLGRLATDLLAVSRLLRRLRGLVGHRGAILRLVGQLLGRLANGLLARGQPAAAPPPLLCRPPRRPPPCRPAARPPRDRPARARSSRCRAAAAALSAAAAPYSALRAAPTNLKRARRKRPGPRA